jgi:hypothetical protein
MKQTVQQTRRDRQRNIICNNAIGGSPLNPPFSKSAKTLCQPTLPSYSIASFSTLFSNLLCNNDDNLFKKVFLIQNIKDNNVIFLRVLYNSIA